MRYVIPAFAFLACAAILWALTPSKTFNAYRDHSFVIDKDFVTVRNTLGRANLLNQILEANEAQLIEKRWEATNLDIRHPLSRKLRSWEFDGVLRAKIRVTRPDTGEMTIDLRQHLSVTQSAIRAEILLAKPLGIGLTDMNELIEITPQGDKTLVRKRLHYSLTRKLPSFLNEMVQHKLDIAADRQIAVFERVFKQSMKSNSGLNFAAKRLVR